MHLNRKQILKFLPKGLLNRFILIMVIPLLVLQIIMCIFFYTRHWDLMQRRLISNVAGDVAFISSILSNSDLNTTQKQHLLSGLKDKWITIRPIATHKTKNLIQNTHSIAKNHPLNEAFKKMDYKLLLLDKRNKMQEVLLILPQQSFILQIAEKRFFSSTVYVFFIWMLATFIFVSVVAFLFMKNQIRSIERLSLAADSFGKGFKSITFKPEGALEVRKVGQSFILMQNRIGRYINERTAMLAGISHDLRTPLTRIKLQLSLMPNTKEIDELNQDVVEMEKMIAGYLDFAGGQGKEQTELFSLNDLLEQLVQNLSKTGQAIYFHSMENFKITARKLSLSRAFSNFISNAGRYAKHCWITLKKQNNKILILIEDDGPGIPEAERDNVFKAFYRLDDSRNTQTGGIGLGLTVAKDTILAHGGTLELKDSTAYGGLAVYIYLPL